MLGSVGIDRRLIYNVDVVLIATTLVLSMVGVAMVYSATHAGPTAGAVPEAARPGRRGARGHVARGRDRLPPARRPRGTALRAVGRGARLRAALRPTDRGHAALGGARRLPAPALRAREARGGRVRGEALLGVPPGVARAARGGASRRGRGAAGAADRARAGPRHRGVPAAAVPGGRVSRRAPDARSRASRRGARARGRARVAAAQGLPEDAHLHLPRPVARPARRRLPCDPVADRRGLRGPGGTRLHGGQPGPARLPARAPHRLRVLGARGGGGLRRRARDARALPAALVAHARDRAARARPARRLHRRRRDGGLRVPGRVQCRNGRGARARQGAPAPPHELRRVVGRLVAHGNRLILSVRMRRFAN